MWNTKFEDRLTDWVNLRDSIASESLEMQLSKINDWWFRVPLSNHYLHIDDIAQWPTPWDLLADNIYCDVARAAGIVYTILMLNNHDIYSCEIINTDQGVLVSVNQGQYILNYAPRTLLNSQQSTFRTLKIVESTILQKNIS